MQITLTCMVSMDGSKGWRMKMNKKMGFPLPQGCTVWGDTVNFSIEVPGGEKCELLFYKKGETEPVQMITMEEAEIFGNLRFLAFPLKEVKAYEYNYRIGEEIVPDPYGKAFSGRKVWGEKERFKNTK